LPGFDFYESVSCSAIVFGIDYFIPKGILGLVVHPYRDKIPSGIIGFIYVDKIITNVIMYVIFYY